MDLREIECKRTKENRKFIHLTVGDIACLCLSSLESIFTGHVYTVTCNSSTNFLKLDNREVKVKHAILLVKNFTEDKKVFKNYEVFCNYEEFIF